MATGRVLQAAEAKEIGLVDHVAAPGGALQAARELAQQMAQHPIEAVRAAKRLLRFAVKHPEAAKHAERRLFASLWDSDYRRAAVARFLNRNK
jgi:enoyl-CoA hydratase